VVTMFGAMFAPRPELVASELARVLKPGGLLGMANWNPESFTGQMFKMSGRHVPPPVLWGDEATVRARLMPFFRDIQTEIIPVDFDLPMNPAAVVVAFFREYFGTTQVAFSRLDAAGQAAFAAELEKLWTNGHAASDKTNHALIHNEYLAVTGILQ
jgi:SAM-dependent methyltransferase